MTRFYFDLHECGHGGVIDEEGIELPDLPAARQYAIKSAREVMMAEVAEGKLCLGCAIVIRDHTGIVVVAVPFAEAISVAFANSC